MATYTNEQVEKMIKDTINATQVACLEWIKHDTEIVDIVTNKVIESSMLTLKEDAKGINYYMHPELKKIGITMTIE
jgi:hypothetical protein